MQDLPRSAPRNDPAPAWVPASAPALTAKQAEGKVAGPLGLILLLGFLLQLGAYLYGRSVTDVQHYLHVTTWATLGFYAVVFAIVVATARRVSFAPLWSTGLPGEAVAVGVFGGVLTAGVVMGLLWAVEGDLQVAPDVKLAVGDATVTSILVAALLLVVAAPVVEELLFRGFAAEAMRHRGAVIALLVSGVLFALWHMRLGGLVYYTILGVLLGVLYWKRGLAGSMAAHAAFNGTLLVVAVAFVIGPGRVIAADGVRLEVPGGWEETASPYPHVLLAASGPSGSSVAVARVPVPGVGRADLQRRADELNAASGELFPGLRARPGTAQVVRTPVGPAIRVRVSVGNTEEELVMLGRGDVLWLIEFAGGGSGRAEGDFEDILATLRLP